MTALVESAGIDYQQIATMPAELKTAAATDTLAPELGRLRRCIVAAAGTDHPQLPAAVAALLTHIDVYRSDYPGLAAILPAALAATQSAAPEFDVPLQLIATALAGGGEPAARLQQLCGAVTAKAVEDCLFDRDARLVSLNEVGGEPHRFGVGAAEFHHRAATRARLLAADAWRRCPPMTPNAVRMSGPGSVSCPRCRRCGLNSSPAGRP